MQHVHRHGILGLKGLLTPGSVSSAILIGGVVVLLAGQSAYTQMGQEANKVVRLLFDTSGKPTGEYEDFMTGFVVSDKQVWGRPVGVSVARDGSLFVTEDGNGTIWRISRTRTAVH
jgi:glucose/arabinose dehydrogenase